MNGDRGRRLSARVRRVPVAARGRTLYVRILSLLVTTVRRAPSAVSGFGLAMSVPLWASMGPAGAAREDEAMGDEPRFGIEVRGAEHVGRALNTAASGTTSVGPVTTVGDRTVIPLNTTFFGGGFGGGGGGDESGSGSGGGGGGYGRSRTVAIAVVGPDGVTIRPVFDATGVAIAALTAGVGLLARAALRRRRRR